MSLFGGQIAPVRVPHWDSMRIRGAQVPVDLKIVAPRLQESGLEAEEIILYGDRLHGS